MPGSQSRGFLYLGSLCSITPPVPLFTPFGSQFQVTDSDTGSTYIGVPAWSTPWSNVRPDRTVPV